MTALFPSAFSGLSRDAFDGEVDPRAPVLDGGAGAALAELEEGLARGDAILLLTGEPGMGKTTLTRVLAARAAPAGVRTVFVHHPQIGFDDLLKLIAAEIGLSDVRARPTFERLRSVQAALASALSRGGRVLVAIDEAQALPDETLEALRLLTTLEAGPRARPLQLLLAGHPELEDRLARKRWRAVEQRVGARVRLEPMDLRAARAWLDARLALANPAAAPGVFTSPALDALARRGGGRPRTMERLARAALAEAVARRERPVRRATVLRAAARVSPPERGGRAWMGLAGAGVAAAVLLVTGLMLNLPAHPGEGRDPVARAGKPVLAILAPSAGPRLDLGPGLRRDERENEGTPFRAAVALDPPPEPEPSVPALRPPLR